MSLLPFPTSFPSLSFSPPPSYLSIKDGQTLICLILAYANQTPDSSREFRRPDVLPSSLLLARDLDLYGALPLSLAAHPCTGVHRAGPSCTRVLAAGVEVGRVAGEGGG